MSKALILRWPMFAINKIWNDKFRHVYGCKDMYNNIEMENRLKDNFLTYIYESVKIANIY